MTGLELIEEYDWREAFSAAELDPAKVASIEARCDGENDEMDWACFGQLADGQWFVLTAGCDYTGWDCRGWGQYEAFATREEAIMKGMDSETRVRLLDSETAAVFGDEAERNKPARLPEETS